MCRVGLNRNLQTSGVYWMYRTDLSLVRTTYYTTHWFWENRARTLFSALLQFEWIIHHVVGEATRLTHPCTFLPLPCLCHNNRLRWGEMWSFGCLWISFKPYFFGLNIQYIKAHIKYNRMWNILEQQSWILPTICHIAKYLVEPAHEFHLRLSCDLLIYSFVTEQWPQCHYTVNLW